MPFDQLASPPVVRHELGPVADDRRPVAPLAGYEDIGEVLGGRQVRSGVLVQQPDAGGGGGLQGGVDVPSPVGRADAFPEGVSGGVVGLAGDQTTVVPAGQVPGAGRGRQGRGDHRRVAVHAWAVDDPAIGRAIELGGARGAVLGPPAVLVPAVGVDRAAAALSCRRLDLQQGLVERLDPGEVDTAQRQTGR